MSINPIYDAIVDEVVAALERGSKLPQQFRISLPPSQFKAMLELGLKCKDTGERLGPDTSMVPIWVSEYMIEVYGDGEE